MWTWCSNAVPTDVSLIIEDNGVGFDPSNAETVGEGLGLIGMRERAALVGAESPDRIDTRPRDDRHRAGACCRAGDQEA